MEKLIQLIFQVLQQTFQVFLFSGGKERVLLNIKQKCLIFSKIQHFSSRLTRLGDFHSERPDNLLPASSLARSGPWRLLARSKRTGLMSFRNKAVFVLSLAFFGAASLFAQQTSTDCDASQGYASWADSSWNEGGGLNNNSTSAQTYSNFDGMGNTINWLIRQRYG